MNNNTTNTVDERGEYIAGLRDLADWLDQNPDIPLPWTGSIHERFSLAVWADKATLGRIVRALPGPIEKDHRATTLAVQAKFRGLAVEAYAERVEEREVVEWRCQPLLAGDDAVQDHASEVVSA